MGGETPGDIQGSEDMVMGDIGHPDYTRLGQNGAGVSAVTGGIVESQYQVTWEGKGGGEERKTIYFVGWWHY